jgi:F-type H+-transporting ATPase subunit alpha
MAAFAQFGSDLDAATLRLLSRGERMVELLKQDQYQPLPVEEQIVMIYAGGEGYYDKLPAEQVRPAAGELINYIRDKHADVLHTIRASGKLDDVRDTLKAACETFFATYSTAADAAAELPAE